MPNQPIPQHIAIIMDGNGRWAQRQGMPRYRGHQAGVNTVREIIKSCGQLGVQYLSLFAFSSENWQRPREEVSLLMDLFHQALKQEIKRLQRNQVRLKVIGDLSAFSIELQRLIQEAEAQTRNNQGLYLQIAANYGGRWDMVQAMQKLGQQIKAGLLRPDQIDQQQIEKQLAFQGIPDPDLFIRTGGEQRISNFMLWQLAYTELYFTEVLWPDFSPADLEAAIADYARRHRRFGRVDHHV